MLLLFSNPPSSKQNSNTNTFLHSPRLPSFLKFSKPNVTCAAVMPSYSSRQGYSRESSYDSTTSQSPSPTYTQGTIHHRRTISRNNSSTPAPLPPSLDGFTELFHSRVSTPFVTPVPSDKSDSSDAKRWQRMLRMQREFHCYKSARLEAAVEALENGMSIEEVPIREPPHRPCDKVRRNLTLW
jgi:hypothetical protein